MDNIKKNRNVHLALERTFGPRKTPEQRTAEQTAQAQEASRLEASRSWSAPKSRASQTLASTGTGDSVARKALLGA
jgi:hypothetical protein